MVKSKVLSCDQIARIEWFLIKAMTRLVRDVIRRNDSRILKQGDQNFTTKTS